MAQVTVALDIDMNILHVENNEKLRTNFSRFFKNKGYTVFSAASPMEAVRFLSNSPQIHLAIIDILFEDTIPNSISGDEFVSKSKEYLKDTKVIAHTGHEDQIKDENRELFNDIIKKGREEYLYQEVDKVFQEEVEAFETRVKNNEYKNEDKYFLANEDMKRHQERLISKLNSAQNKYAPLVIFEDKEYSAADLINEIENNTEIGKLHINLMLDFLEDK